LGLISANCKLYFRLFLQCFLWYFCNSLAWFLWCLSSGCLSVLLWCHWLLRIHSSIRRHHSSGILFLATHFACYFSSIATCVFVQVKFHDSFSFSFGMWIELRVTEVHRFYALGFRVYSLNFHAIAVVLLEPEQLHFKFAAKFGVTTTNSSSKYAFLM